MSNSYTRDGYTVRRLQPKDWQVLKQLRLEALKQEPGVFSSNYAREAAFSDEEWMHRLRHEDRASFCLFKGKEPAGITGIIADPDDRSAAVLIASYIRQEHREKGLSALYYQARLDWAREKGFKTVKVSHRSSNAISKAANQRFGFVFTHALPHTWPDGTEEDQLFYELRL